MLSTRIALWTLLFIVFNADSAQAEAEGSVGGNELLSLLKFKEGILDPFGHLNDWVASSALSHCSWSGVSCDSSGSVTSLDLQGRNLSGVVSSAISDLSNLSSISLSDNNFTQLFPVALLACKQLSFLDLGYNNLFGQLPSNISSLTSLEYLNLQYNAFSGPIPADIGKLSELRYFDVWSCFFTAIPPELGNLTKLTNLTLSYNPFTTGLPQELSRLSNLQSLKCGGCQLNGRIPKWIGQLKALDFLELTWNALSGHIPASIMQLPKLTFLELYSNRLTGPIPSEIESLVSLTDLDLNSNLLSGSIPDALTRLPNLSLIHLWNNSLSGAIPKGFDKLRNLRDVSFFMNELTGRVPSELGMHTSGLEIFDVSTNLLSGPVPSGLCTGKRLKKLILFNNSFAGEFPQEYEHCTSLVRVRVYHNNLSGELPSGVWGLPQMTILEIYDNAFEGPVPPSLGNAVRLQTLRIHENKLSGSLPAQIGQLQLLDDFSAYENGLSGPLPDGLTKCSSLTRVLLGHNNIEGPVPSGIGNLLHLAYLDLSYNRLSGSVPPSTANLVSLISLDLSNNRLTGSLPMELSKLNLKDFLVFNLSENDLSGMLPQGMDPSLISLSLAGNPKLCLSSSTTWRKSKDCPVAHRNGTSERRGKSELRAWIAGIILTAAAAFSALCSYHFYKRYHRTCPQYDGYIEAIWTMIPFQKLAFTLDDVVSSLQEDNVIGTGAAGKVYKAAIKGNLESYLAVKKLWSSCTASDEEKKDHGFRTEVEILGRIRHFNIVRLLCCCSKRDTNLLVYEYVPNGSLGDVLHEPSRKVSCVLDWPTRYKIALGAAQGLSYLHHDCLPQILHRDIKSNNILLTEEYDALLADFGLAKLVKTSSTAAAAEEEFSMSVLAGSHGYIAPEYAHRLKVNEKSDVYSFGVVLLELVTGKRPVGSPEFGEDGVDLVAWVCANIQSNRGVAHVLDPRIASSGGTPMLLVLKIALRCTSAQPSARPSMREVVQMIIEADPNPDAVSKNPKQHLR